MPDFVALTLAANSLQVVLIPVLVGGVWCITASSRYIVARYRNRWFVALSLSGIVLYVAPRCRVADQIGWAISGLDKGQWESIHINGALFFVLAGSVLAWPPCHSAGISTDHASSLVSGVPIRIVSNWMTRRLMNIDM